MCIRDSVWAGAIDDLWSMGKPTGKGGPWKNTFYNIFFRIMIEICIINYGSNAAEYGIGEEYPD